MKSKLALMIAALALSTPAHAADSDIPTWNGTEKEEAYAACLVGRSIIYFNRNPVMDQQVAIAEAKENCGKEPDTLKGNAHFDEFMAFAVGDWIGKKYLPGKDEYNKPAPTPAPQAQQDYMALTAPADAAEFKPHPVTKITCLPASNNKDKEVTITAKFDKQDPQKILSMEVTGRLEFKQTEIKQVNGQPAWGWTGNSIKDNNEQIVGLMSYHGKWHYIEQLYKDNQPTAPLDYPNCHNFGEVAEAMPVPQMEGPTPPPVEEPKPVPAPPPPPLLRAEPKAAPRVEDYKPAPPLVEEPKPQRKVYKKALPIAPPPQQPLTMGEVSPAPEEHQRQHRRAAPRRDYAPPPRREAAPRWREEAPPQEDWWREEAPPQEDFEPRRHSRSR
jgi:hypothetical protein